jgi:hypothetical protein
MLVTWFSNFVSVVIHTHMHLLQLCFYVSEFLEISQSARFNCYYMHLPQSFRSFINGQVFV